MLVVLLYQTSIAIYNVLIFTAEAKAIDRALDFIRTCDTINVLYYLTRFQQ